MKVSRLPASLTRSGSRACPHTDDVRHVAAGQSEADCLACEFAWHLTLLEVKAPEKQEAQIRERRSQMTTKSKAEASKSKASNVRPEPAGMQVRTAVRAGFSFVAKVSKSSPL
jgi:hypothetical protein